MQSHDDPKPLFGLLALIVPYGFAVILLTVFPTGQDTSFNSVVTFGIVGGFSLMFIMITTPYNNVIRWKDKPRKDDFIYFFAIPLGKYRLGKLTVIPFGLVAMLVFGLVVPFFLGVIGILIALGIGGLVLGVQLQRSKSFFIPWITHFMYNSMALILASASILPLSASPFYVPDFSRMLAAQLPASSITTQFSYNIALQLIAVSFSEEFLKISMAVGSHLAFRTGPKGSIAIAVFAWTMLHTILSYRLFLNF